MSVRLQNNSFDHEPSGNERDAERRNQFAKTKPYIERSGSQQKVEERVKSTKEVSEQRGTGEGYKRSHKISSLQQEFEELKKKIKEVENKNEKIIEKIQHNKNGPKRSSQEEA
jgi:seryl-tRNA synthetase